MENARRDQDGLSDHDAARALYRSRAGEADHDLRGEMAMGFSVPAKAFEARPVLAEPDLP
ncbi:hypothetical protein [Phenylobacterium sp. SCN 70-31]|uniref:hypothetical protein n=1 Tax=Phenylobacterium sp. SCN 70-31 TaxID=1660129 RepID=UPI000868F07A|nr:hypothetical protein [Phenylobacterium sp. SCN 70-31]ODT85029.1 MAG: hypothetical protein ABS78_21830 [Phenylobacterium sp. SCN 70-31]